MNIGDCIDYRGNKYGVVSEFLDGTYIGAIARCVNDTDFYCAFVQDFQMKEYGVLQFEYDYHPSVEDVISDYVNYVSEMEINKHI